MNERKMLNIVFNSYHEMLFRVNGMDGSNLFVELQSNYIFFKLKLSKVYY